MDILGKTNVTNKEPGDKLKSSDINSINSVLNNSIDAINNIMVSYYYLNQEINQFTRKFSLEEAISLVPESRRIIGINLRFLHKDFGYIKSYYYSGPSLNLQDWNNLDYWRDPDVEYIDGGIWE